MSQYVKTPFRFWKFSGRASRKEYIGYFLFNNLIAVIVFMLSRNNFDVFTPGIKILLISMIPQPALSVRRLHDAGDTGWLSLAIFIPVIGTLVFLYFMSREGDVGENRYGKDPRVR